MKLTTRHQQVARLLTEGARDKEIATKLNLSTETIKDYVRQLQWVLNARNRTHVAVLFDRQQRA